MNLSENFTLEEMIFSQTAARRGIDNTPSPEHFRNLRRLCALLEDVRDVCAAPVRVTSGYRCEELNRAVGGAKNSQHTRGEAADCTAIGISVEEMIDMIIEADLDFHQLIKEYDSWAHISIPPLGEKAKKQVLIIDKMGTRMYNS